MRLWHGQWNACLYSLTEDRLPFLPVSVVISILQSGEALVWALQA